MSKWGSGLELMARLVSQKEEKAELELGPRSFNSICLFLYPVPVILNIAQLKDSSLTEFKIRG